MNVTIESHYSTRRVEWSGSATSNELVVSPGRTFSVYVDSSFSGTKLFIESLVAYDGKLPVWVRRAADGTDLEIVVAADKVNYVPAEAFSGINRIRLVSDATETATGMLAINT